MSPQQKTAISFTKRLLLFLIVGTASIFLIKAIYALGPQSPESSSNAQSSEERELQYKIPSHVPIKIKIREEKEKAVKNLRNDKWLGDFEIEVTNTSTKPIYFLELWIMLPEIVSENGGIVGVPLRYGRMAFIRHDTLPLADDMPIKPGEAYTFAIPEKYKRGWYARKARGQIANPKKLEIQFAQLSFGDGTGFERTDAMPYPHKKEQSLAEPPPEAFITATSFATGRKSKTRMTRSLVVGPGMCSW